MSREHIGWPFGTPATDQDSSNEIRDCAIVAAIYAPGDRPANPDFGARPRTHRQGGVDLADLERRLTEIDPRTAPVASGNEPALMAALRRAEVQVQVAEGTS
ncbi:MAG: hypothetical protein AVDCRST_MAG68-2139 [uncultured Gemmatimonadetes bacterium]|uniref:Uncharacterized protein n=1 Tax=uncultured Gemmatimonadota bacterium TaxID=203437 RepID=A0A6J4L6E6_9BACT|nr:MAG: hypothetical protein AVDCRST_MAG68-2139 [uncultured Gemmatimonadota bacterium]